MTKELIKEAREWLARGPVVGSGTEIMRRLADALEAVPDAATATVKVQVEFVGDLLIEELKRERDAALEARDGWAARMGEFTAALAAVERVAKIHGPSDEFPAGCDYCERLTPCSTRAALDGAPEPEDVWEYQWGEPGESFEGFDSFATEELARAEMELDSDYPSHRVMRRRKAGPWLPVGGESKP